MCMLFLTDSLYNEIVEATSENDMQTTEGFLFLTPAIALELKKYSLNNGKLAYIETDYYGGVGSQSAVLFENGEKTICSVSDNSSLSQLPMNMNEWPINSVLIALGVRKSLDEFESINLDDYRCMPEEDEEN